MNKKYFTLMELLIVIAIVLILMSILMPALKNAREMANSIACMNNLRQLNLATLQYCEDNKGQFLYYTSASPNVWYFPLSGVNAQSNIYLKHGGYGKKTAPYFCISNKAEFTSGSTKWTNYAINANLSGTAIQGVTKPNIISFLDSYNPYSATFPTWYSNSGGRYSNPWKDTYPVHKQNVNAAFLDGHASSIKISPRPADPMPDGSNLVDLDKDYFWPLRN